MMTKLTLLLKSKTNKATDTSDQSLMEKNVKSTKKTPTWLSDMRYGRSISVDFFKRNAWLPILIMVLTVSLIGLRYKTKTRMSEIKTLQRELSRAESDKLREKSEYMSLIRETEMLRLVREKGLGLELQEQPPYHLSETPEE